MIGPTTRLFGLVMTDPRVEGHVTRLYNYLFGFNGLDAAYLSFLVKPQQLVFTLEGFLASGQTELLQVAPPHQEAVGRWLQLPGLIDTVRVREGRGEGSLTHPEPTTWLEVDQVCSRASSDAAQWFGRALEVPPDWRDVVHEMKFRPCKLTHDDFERLHVRRPA